MNYHYLYIEFWLFLGLNKDTHESNNIIPRESEVTFPREQQVCLPSFQGPETEKC